MAEPSLLNRDINEQFKEFLETIIFTYSTPTYSDPYSQEPIAVSVGRIPLQVSWHDVTTEALKTDSSGGAILGVLLPGDAYCIYQGTINLFAYQLPRNLVAHRGISYMVETTTNPSANRWVITLRRQR
jgi:hypothetical protein